MESQQSSITIGGFLLIGMPLSVEKMVGNSEYLQKRGINYGK